MKKETAPYRQIEAQFEELYGRPPAIVVAAPGRVNLIGEHTDYNEGYGLPVAIDRYILVAAGRREDRKVSLQALNLGEEDAFSLDEIERGEREWGNYGRGAAWEKEYEKARPKKPAIYVCRLAQGAREVTRCR